MSLKARILEALFGAPGVHISYSQGGEDLLLAKLLHRQLAQGRGYYVDVGSFHPTRFSNTYLFYRAGWRGLCIDPRPGSAAQHLAKRPRDVFEECGVGQQEGELTYYYFGEENPINSFSRAFVEQMDMLHKVKQTYQRPIQPLSSLLQKHLPAGQALTLLNIDAEGMDLEVLQSLDWATQRPLVVAIELNGPTQQVLAQDPAALLLQQQGYTAAAHSYLLPQHGTWIFTDEAALAG